jgi:hypothetical protein
MLTDSLPKFHRLGHDTPNFGTMQLANILQVNRCWPVLQCFAWEFVSVLPYFL